MQRQRVDTILGVGFQVDSGTMEGPEGPVSVKILTIVGGGHTMRFPMAEESAHKLADELRADGIVTAKVIPIRGTKGVG